MIIYIYTFLLRRNMKYLIKSKFKIKFNRFVTNKVVANGINKYDEVGI